MKLILNLLIIIYIFLLNKEVIATELIEVPKEELETEIVFPKFDKFDMVKNPNVVFSRRFEIGFFSGFNFTEPIFNPLRYGIELGYHWNEIHSINLSMAQWAQGLNHQYVAGIASQGGPGNQQYDLTRVPQPRFSFWGIYNVKAYYGKISLSKKDVLNMSLYTQFGLGVTQFEHKSYPGIAIGIGQRFYFNSYWALKLEARIQYQNGVNPFLGDGKLKKNQPAPNHNEFSDLNRIGTLVEVGFVWLL